MRYFHLFYTIVGSTFTPWHFPSQPPATPLQGTHFLYLYLAGLDSWHRHFPDMSIVRLCVHNGDIFVIFQILYISHRFKHPTTSSSHLPESPTTWNLQGTSLPLQISHRFQSSTLPTTRRHPSLPNSYYFHLLPLRTFHCFKPPTSSHIPPLQNLPLI